MIRLTCLAEVMSRLNKDEATVMCVSNPNYTELLKVLPWVLASRSWYETVQIKMLCGIRQTDIKKMYEDREHFTNAKLNRIKTSSRFPQAEIVAGHNKLGDDAYIELFKTYWNTVLSKLQIGLHPLDPDEAPGLYKVWWIHELARKEAYFLKHISMMLDRQLSTMVDVVSSLPYLDKIALVNLYDNSFSITKAAYLRNFGAEVYKTQSQSAIDVRVLKLDESIQQYWEMYNNYTFEVEMLYNFLYRINCSDCLNDAIVNGEYELYFY